MTVWDTLTINNLELKNRWVRSATWEGMANDDGSVTEGLVKFYKTLAESGLGLIISSHTFIDLPGKAGFKMTGIQTDDIAKTHIPLVEACHSEGVPIACQINHCGAATSVKGAVPVVLCRFDGDADKQKACMIHPEAHVLTTEELEQIEDAFVAAAVRAKEIAGYDAVQLHAAHGYFISQTLSDIMNQRTDKYGEDRTLFIRNTVRKMREAVGPDYPILVKINGEDCLDTEEGKPSGNTIDQTVALLSSLDGLDAAEISGGSYLASPAKGTIRRGNFFPVAKQGYFKEQAMKVKAAVGDKMKIISVGGIRTVPGANAILDAGIDAVAMSRPLIAEPNLIKLLKEDETLERVKCTSCAKCLGHMFKTEEPICCAKHM